VCPPGHSKQPEDSGFGDITLGENEWPNPVAAPDELDDVADDVLGRDEPNRRDPMDGLDDLPSYGDTSSGSDPMEDLFSL